MKKGTVEVTLADGLHVLKHARAVALGVPPEESGRWLVCEVTNAPTLSLLVIGWAKRWGDAVRLRDRVLARDAKVNAAAARQRAALMQIARADGRREALVQMARDALGQTSTP